MIELFRKVIGRGYVPRTYTWHMQFLPSGIWDIPNKYDYLLSFKVRQVTHPFVNINYDPIGDQYIVKFAGVRMIDDLTITVIEDPNYSTIDYLWRLYQNVYDVENGLVNPPYGEYGYKRDCKIIYEDGFGAEIFKILARGMSIKSIAHASGLDYSTSGIIEYNVTFSIDEIIPQWSSIYKEYFNKLKI